MELGAIIIQSSNRWQCNSEQLSAPELVAAVSNAGGLGVLAVTWLEIDAMIADIRQTKQLTGRPFGINLVLAFDYEANLERCLAEGAAVVFSSWGDPRPLRPVVARAGAVHVHACGPVAEAWTRRGAD